MRSYGLGLIILIILIAVTLALAAEADSVTTSVGAGQSRGYEAGFMDSTEQADADSLPSGLGSERGIINRLLMPALVTAAAGGILILLFTQRGR